MQANVYLMEIRHLGQRSNQAPKNGGEFTVSMVSGFKNLPREYQKLARDGFSKFSHQAMADLHKSGVSVRFVKPLPGDTAGGRFIDRGNQIEIYAEAQDPHAEAYLIHELVHAADRLKFQKENSLASRLLTTSRRDAFSSRQDPELCRLHLDYAKRTLPSVGQEIASYLRARPQDQQAKPVIAGGKAYDWSLTESTLELKERHRALNTLEALQPSLNMGVLGGFLGVTALALGIGAAAPLVGAAVAVPLLVFGAKNLLSTHKTLQDERALIGHQSENVTVRPDGMTFKLNQKLAPAEQATSVYATLDRQPEEYLAESMTEFLQSAQNRASLKARDPEMHDYCQSWNLADS